MQEVRKRKLSLIPLTWPIFRFYFYAKIVWYVICRVWVSRNVIWIKFVFLKFNTKMVQRCCFCLWRVLMARNYNRCLCILAHYMNDLDWHRVPLKKIYRFVIRYVSVCCGRQILIGRNRSTRMRNIEEAEILIGFESTTSLNK